MWRILVELARAMAYVAIAASWLYVLLALLTLLLLCM